MIFIKDVRKLDSLCFRWDLIKSALKISLQRKHGQDLFVLFLDLVKLFFDALVKKRYLDVRIIFDLEPVKATFESTFGVKQGDNLAPLLFLSLSRRYYYYHVPKLVMASLPERTLGLAKVFHGSRSASLPLRPSLSSYPFRPPLLQLLPSLIFLRHHYRILRTTTPQHAPDHSRKLFGKICISLPHLAHTHTA